MKGLVRGFMVVALFASMLAGCSSVRKNVTYFPVSGGTKLATSVKGVILPVVDLRESARIYPKQIISHTSYYGEKSFDINDKPVDQVFEDALAVELYNLGLGIVKADIETPLDKQNKDKVRGELMAENPEARVAIGLKVREFMASSQRDLITTDVKFTAAVELYILDVGTGDLVWSDYRTEQTDTVISAGRNYMVDNLDQALSGVMKKAVKDNLTLRDVLVKAANR